MADERVFRVTIDGLEYIYKNTIKAVDALKLLEDKTIKIIVETGKVNKVTSESTTQSRNKTKSLTDEERAQKKLLDTQDKGTRVISNIEKLQAQANIQLRERTNALNLQAQAELTSSNTIAGMSVRLKQLKADLKNMDTESDIFAQTKAEIEELDEKIKSLSPSTNGLTKQLNAMSDKMESRFTVLNNGVNSVANNSKEMLNLFQTGVGVVALFGDESDSTSKILVQTGKILTLINTLQALNNGLLAKGAIASKASAIMEGIHTAQIRARATAIALSTKNTLSATIAQTAFNIVANANPYVLLAMALITVIGALVAFSSGTESATEKQKKMNDAVEKSIDLKDRYASKIQSLSNANINQMQRELELMQSQGASEGRLSQKRRQIYEERLKQAKKNAGYYDDEIKSIDENSKRVDQYTKELIELDRLLYEGKIKNMDAYNTKRDAILQKMDISNKRLAQGLVAKEELEKAENDLSKFNAEVGRKGLELGKKNALALAEYRVLMAQKGSKEELIAQIAVANQKLKNDLSATDITQGERLKRTKETLNEIAKLEETYRKAQLQDSIALIDANLVLVKKGTLEEYSLKVSKIDEQRKIELDNTDLTKNEKLKIENKYQADLKKLTDDYAKSVSENEINTSIATLNARLASVKDGSKEEYDLRIDLAKANAKLAREEVESTIQNEELKASKILEINANLQSEIKELGANGEVANNDSFYQQETLSLTKQLQARTISKRAYEEQLQNITVESLSKEITIRKKYGQDTTDLEITLSEQRITQAEIEKNKRTKYFEEMYNNLKAISDYIMTGVTAVFDGINSVLQSQLDDANDKYDAISQKYDEVVAKREESSNRINELEEDAKNARGGRALVLQEQINSEMEANRQLADQEKQLAKEKEKQEKEIAKKEKQMKKAQIASDIVSGVSGTALAVINALQVKPFPLGVVLAGVAGAMGALQVGVMTKQLSKLEDGGLLKGKRHSSGGMRVEGTNIEVEGGEYVVNRESTAKNIGLIRYINNERRELKPTDISSFFSKSSQSFEPPFKRMFESGGQLPIINTSVNVDNEILIDAIKSMKFEPKVAVTDINNAQDNIVKVDNWTGL